MIDIRIGDCREVLKTIPENSIHCCVTSPPYFGLRSYYPECVRMRTDLTEEETVFVLSELNKLCILPTNARHI